MMEIYLVGGAVRDHLLGRKVKDMDFVVVGATEQEMLRLGFTKVGADFPVFLHPVSGNEYALARRERKVAAGYNGFEVDFDPSVTLEDDLIRRDLTINAMAVPVMDGNDNNLAYNWNNIIDPFGGQVDLQSRILRHVSDAFAEDPVRILRVARFAARYKFSIALETVALMQELVKAGELDHLVPERVWSETERALSETWPMSFFNTLNMSSALDKLFPELNFSNGFIENSLCETPADPELRFALVCLQIDSAIVSDLMNRLKVPNNFRRRAENAKTLCKCLRKEKLTPGDIVATIAWIKDVNSAIKVAYYSAYNTAWFRRNLTTFEQIAPHVQAIRFTDLTVDQQQTLKGAEIGQALQELQELTAKLLLR